MMHRRGDLNNGLKEALFGLIERQPYEFPMFVRFKELCPAIAGKSLGERRSTPIKHQGFILSPAR